MLETAATAAAPARACATCGQALDGRYCSRCGEEALDPHARSVRHFLEHTVLHEFSHVDGKIFRSFRCLLFRPGFLASEYFAGRRQPYINPVRVLLTALVLFALLVPAGANISWSVGSLRMNLMPPPPPVGATIEGTLGKLDVLGILSGRFARIEARGGGRSEAAVEKFNHELKTFGTALSFVNVAMVAGVLYLLFRRTRPYFVEHLVFSLHLAAFVLLFMLAAVWIFEAIVRSSDGTVRQGLVAAAFLVILTFQLAYLRAALLRFYYGLDRRSLKWWGRGCGITWRVAGTVALLFVANSVCITAVYAAGAAIALARL